MNLDGWGNGMDLEELGKEKPESEYIEWKQSIFNEKYYYSFSKSPENNQHLY